MNIGVLAMRYFAPARVRAFLAAVSLLLALPAHAATPADGTLSPATPTLTFGSGPFAVSNPTPAPEVDNGPRCNATLNPCDSYELTVSLPAGFAAANPGASIRISTSWSPAQADVDLWVFAGGTTDTDGTSEGVADGGASSNNPEVVTLPLTADATKTYTIKIVPFAATGVATTTTIELLVPPPPPPDADGDGITDADDDCPNTPPGTSVDTQGCPLPPGDPLTCTSPGKTLLTDEDLDNTSATPGTDLLSFQLAQPPQSPVGDKIEDQLLAFRINTDAGITPTPATSWFVSFVTAGGPRGVRMTGDASGNPVFESYVVGAANGGATDGRFVGGARAAHASSSLDAAAGAITIVVKVTDLGLTAPGQVLAEFNSGVTQTTGGVATAVDDGMPENDLSRSDVSYALHDNVVCGGPQLKGVQPPPPATGLPPRFQIHVAPAALGNDAAEPSIGFNKHTQRSMFISYTQALRQTYQEDIVPPLLPQSCPALWEDKSGTLTAVNSLDPILFTDEVTGRTFNSQLTGSNSLFEFTDDDGENWMPGQIGASNGGADHQTVASGPYPAAATPPTATWPATGDKRAVYYCSQSVATAFCARSDDGGQTFGPGYTFKNLDCGAGALHGHVKVAPDGTVYVPDSSQCVAPTGVGGGTAGNVITHVSENAGLTWTQRAIPTSTGGAGSDPSIGIATDGTLYMCYENGDSRARMAVSHDKGATWENDQDIGAALGITQTRFPQAIAGDPDRAACAFLGTTGARPESPTNDGSSLGFEGVWHGFVATTYDGGQTYHLVNVTPGDPVQGWGGVGGGDNRNLLDFNDLQIDDEGRLLFALADGCTGGCVNDPSANGFAAKATIIRQTGGRSMFAALDNAPGLRFNNPVALAPEAACARQDLSKRSPIQAEVKWDAPDTGGADIGTYRVFRATDPAGPFTLLGSTAGTKKAFVDTTALATVEKYYYQVETENPVGIAPLSNIIELEITAEAVDTCTLPGEVIALDVAGDGAGDDTDILYLAVAEPPAFPDAFVITEKIANFTAGTPPASSFYPILFPTKGNLYIALDATQGPPKFTYGTYENVGQGVLAFTEAGTLPDSSFTADGTITFVVPRTLLGDPAVGAVIAGFDARTRVGAQSATSRDTAGPSDYTVRGTEICTAVQPLLASLAASVTQGKAPLPVTFTISGTPPDGATLSSYSILYGDEPGANPTPYTGPMAGGTAVVSHTYTAPGVYRARVTVTDSNGDTSENLAEQTVTVTAADGVGKALDNTRLGGGLPPLTLLALGLFALARRRTRG